MEVYRTDKEGEIILTTNGKKLYKNYNLGNNDKNERL